MILLDAGLLGLIATKDRTPQVSDFERWMKAITRSGADLLIPDVARFDLRVIYVPNEGGDSVFVVTAYPLADRALKAYRRRGR